MDENEKNRILSLMFSDSTSSINMPRLVAFVIRDDAQHLGPWAATLCKNHTMY